MSGIGDRTRPPFPLSPLPFRELVHTIRIEIMRYDQGPSFIEPAQSQAGEVPGVSGEVVPWAGERDMGPA